MAKFGRFDPRNKKHNRHKEQSLYKDLRIRMDEEKGRRKNWTKVSWTETETTEGEHDDYEEDRV